MEKPTIYIVAGANGSGKTTFANEFLPNFVDCREFLNAWWIYDASELPPTIIAKEEGGNIDVVMLDMYKQVIRNAGVKKNHD